MRIASKRPALKYVLPVIAALLILTVAFAVVYFGRSEYLHWCTQEPFKDKTAALEASYSFTNPYADQIPLHEMDQQNLKRVWNYIKPAELVSDTGDASEHATMELPFDLHYYSGKNEHKPALTLKKGEKIYLGTNVDGGYGLLCWPDYDKAWRYGIPFQTEAFVYDEIVFTENAGYYVKTDDLVKLYSAVYNQSRKTADELKWMAVTNPDYKAFVCSQTVFAIDSYLYTKGLFDSPALHEKIVLWW